MKKKSIAMNIVWSGISLVISTAITLGLLPYVSSRIGIEAYGYIALCNNFISYIDLIASTINVYATRFISIEYHKHNYNKANVYFNSVFISNIIIMGVLFIPLIAGIVNLEKILIIPKELINEVKLLFFLSVINYGIVLLGVVYTTAAFVKDVLYIDTKIKTEGAIIKALLLGFSIFILYPHIWYVPMATIICSVFILLRNILLTHKYTVELKLQRGYFSLKAVIEIVKNGIWNTVASLGTTLNSGLDLLVTNMYLGATKMGQLSIPKTLSSFITVFITAVSNSFRPQLLFYYSKGDNDKLKDGFLESMRLCGAVTCTVFCVFSAIGYNFLTLWVPNQNIQLVFELTLLTFLAETLTGIVKPLHYGCVLTGKLKIPCISNLCVGAFNVISMIILLNVSNKYGLYIVALTTVIGNIIYNFIIMPLYVTSILKIKRTIIIKMILKYIFVTFFIAFCQYYIFNRYLVHNWIELFITAIVATLFALMLYIVIMLNTEEKKKLIYKIKNKLHIKHYL